MLSLRAALVPVLAPLLLAVGLLAQACCPPPCPPPPCATGAGGASSTSASSASGRAPCALCGDLVDGSSDPACPGSEALYAALEACACQAGGACASICPSGANCFNDPLATAACKTCVDAGGCSSAWNACLNDTGVDPATSSSSASTGGGCVCDPLIPLCPGNWSCNDPGPYTNSLVSGSPPVHLCGSAEYCSPCCDPGDACKIHGACAVTGVAGDPCIADYACCSGICTAGACAGICGVPLP
jgi:hypothetical protein